MTTTSISTTWVQALTLAERQELTRGEQLPITSMGRKRFARWRESLADLSDAQFESLLRQKQLDPSNLQGILSLTDQDLSERLHHAPDWMINLDQDLAKDNPGQLLPFIEELKVKKGKGFVMIAAPFVRAALKRIRKAIKDLDHHTLPLLEDVEPLLFDPLTKVIVQLSGRTLVQEMHIARLEGHLQAETPELRYTEFMEMLAKPEITHTILRQYPVLARVLHHRISQWESFVLETLHRLTTDWTVLTRRFFSQESPGPITRFDFTAGDTHDNGRSVVIIGFRNGSKLVYKPRPLGLDRHFQDLLAWCSQRLDFDFKTHQILDRGDYGWVEYVHAEACPDQPALERFYLRLGALLGLLYAIEATDFHHENLIAAGEHPVLIDLESLFQPRFGEGLLGGDSDMMAHRVISYSVARVGLLPKRIWGGADGGGLDLSGMGHRGGQLSPRGMPTFEEIGADHMRFVRKRRLMGASNNRPSLDGKPADPLLFTDQLIRGFSSMYQLILKNRHQLLDDHGPLAVFSNDRSRVIFRPTRAYAVLWEESFHPDLLRDAIHRDRHFDHLAQLDLHSDFYRAMLNAEQRDLLRGDIPMFITKPGSSHAWSMDGETFMDILDQSGLAGAMSHLKKLDQNDLQRQIWFIKASMTALIMGGDGLMPRCPLPEITTEADNQSLIDAACQIGDRLAALAIPGQGEDLAWIGLTARRDQTWKLLPLDFDLYGGHAGIALAFARLGVISGRSRYTQIAKGALLTMQRQIKNMEGETVSIGAYTGWCGVAYVYIHLAALLNQPQYLEEARKIIRPIATRITQDSEYDLFSGGAGAIIVLLMLHQKTNESCWLDLAQKCGDHLLKKAATMQRGIGWILEFAGSKPLAGMSHGNAGIAMALAQLGRATGNQKFFDAAKEAIEYERSVYSHEHRNWPDLRENFSNEVKRDQQITHFNLAWCHGAVGIGLARIKTSLFLNEPQIAQEIDIALQTTIEQGFGSNHCLCHGDLGNVELLLAASQLRQSGGLAAKARQIAAGVLKNFQKEGYLCGVPLGVETPGYMTGLAGMCDMLLRLAVPNKISSVLTLDPPS